MGAAESTSADETVDMHFVHGHGPVPQQVPRQAPDQSVTGRRPLKMLCLHGDQGNRGIAEVQTKMVLELEKAGATLWLCGHWLRERLLPNFLVAFVVSHRKGVLLHWRRREYEGERERSLER